MCAGSGKGNQRRDFLYTAEHIPCLCGNAGAVGKQRLTDFPCPVQITDTAFCGKEQLTGTDLCAGGKGISCGKPQFCQNTGYFFGTAQHTRLTGIEGQRTWFVPNVQAKSGQIQVGGILLNEGIQFAVRNINQIASHLRSLLFRICLFDRMLCTDILIKVSVPLLLLYHRLHFLSMYFLLSFRKIRFVSIAMQEKYHLRFFLRPS